MTPSYALPSPSPLRVESMSKPVNIRSVSFRKGVLPATAAALAAVVLSASWAAAESPKVAPSRRPNIVLFLIDDLGWTDLSCMGSKLYETPNLDRLAADGLRFTHAYSACTVCSPTRAAVLTGKYPARLHITDWIPGQAQRPHSKLLLPDWTKQLPLEETTLAELLKGAGYATASVGKWHLGDAGFEPTRQGFDVNIGGTKAGSPPGYFGPASLPGIELKAGESLTERLTEEAARFIESHREEPFFIYFPHYTVHTPLQAKPDVVEKYRAKIERLGLAETDVQAPRDLQRQHPQQHPVYAAMIESMDQSVGRIMQTLDRLQLADDTIILFTGDNGGLQSSTDNRPARVGKGSAYEGGVRVPLIVKYPRAGKPNGTSDAAMISIDYVPTLLDLAGLPASATPIDGVSFAGLLRGGPAPQRSDLFWHYPHYHAGGATPYGAVRSGDWRLIEFYEDGRVELYNLRDDVGESRDLAQAEPSRTAELHKRLQAWRTSVGAQMPAPNPNFDAAKDAMPVRRKPGAKPKA